MFKKCLENLMTCQEKSYQCHLCHLDVTVYATVDNFELDLLQHIETREHQQSLQQRIDEEVRNIRSHKFATISEDEQRILVLNSIIFDNFFKCQLCNVTGELNNIFLHIEAADHQQNKLKVDEESEENASEMLSISEREQFIENEIYCVDDNPRLFQCRICNCSISGLENIFSHIKSVAHIAIKLKEKFDGRSASQDEVRFEKFSLYEDSLYICNTCNYFMATEDDIYEHFTGILHGRNLRKEATLLEYTNCEEAESISNKKKKKCIKDDYFYCAKCNNHLKLSETRLQCHCLLHLHKEQPDLNFDIIRFVFTEYQKLEYTKCLLCDVSPLSEQELAIHLSSKEHNKKLSALTLAINKEIDNDNVSKEMSDDVHQLNSYLFDPNTDIHIAKLHVQAHDQMQSSVESQTATSIEEQNSIQQAMTPKFYKCFLCGTSCKNISSLFRHYKKESGHVKRFRNFHMLINDLDLNRVKETKNEKPSSTNEKSEVFKATSKQKKKTRSRAVQQLSSSRGILDIDDEYISVCLESTNEDYMYKANYDEIDKLQLGISLTFPSDSYRYCISCNHKIPLDLQYLYEHLHDPVHIDNLQDLVESGKGFEQNPDQFSELDLAKSCMELKENSKWIHCFACNQTVSDDDDEIRAHVNSVNHLSVIEFWKKDINSLYNMLSTIMNEPWYHTDRFCCYVCSKTFREDIKFAKHLKLLEHVQKEKLTVGSEANNQLNICYACSTCWYGSSDYNKHSADDVHKRHILSSTMYPEMNSNVLELLDDVNRSVQDFVKESDKVIQSGQQNRVKQLLKAIEATIRPFYPNVKAYAFGSRISNLGFANSDVDVFVDCENKYNDVGSQQSSRKYIYTLQKRFKYASSWKVERAVMQSRVPIIKLQHVGTGFKCDLSFISGLGVEKSALIR